MQENNTAFVYMFVGILCFISLLLYFYITRNKAVTVEPPKADVNAWTGVAKENMLDYQFSESNRPLVIYKDMFTRSAPWIGGYDIAIGKTIISRANQGNIGVTS
jgi:hypothetical protein